MSWQGVFSQLMAVLTALLLAPLMTGWVNQWRARLQNKSAPGLLQPYRTLHKLFMGSGQCAEVTWRFLGLSIAEWSLACFAGLAGYAVWLMFSARSASR